jgi:hypothetical protein
MGKSEGTQLHAQPAQDSSAESANYIEQIWQPLQKWQAKHLFKEYHVFDEMDGEGEK